MYQIRAFALSMSSRQNDITERNTNIENNFQSFRH